MRSGGQTPRHGWRWARAILNPQEFRQGAGLASRAALADARAVFLGIGWTVVSEIF